MVYSSDNKSLITKVILQEILILLFINLTTVQFEGLGRVLNFIRDGLAFENWALKPGSNKINQNGNGIMTKNDIGIWKVICASKSHSYLIS